MGKRVNKQYRSGLLGSRRRQTEGNDEWEEEEEREIVVGQRGNEQMSYLGIALKVFSSKNHAFEKLGFFC